MAITKLSDMFVPQVFNEYLAVNTVAKSLLMSSGIMTDMTEILRPQMAGTTVTMPFMNDLTGDDEVVDDRYDLSINSVSTGTDVAVKLFRAKTFGSTDLAALLSGADPMGHIAARTGAYWAGRVQATGLAVLKGVFAASSMSNNLLDISGLSGAAAYADADSFIDAKARLGDHADDLSGIICHSDTAHSWEKQNLIDVVKDSEGQSIATYRGKRVIIDDGMPKSNGVYDTYIFGPGAMAFAQADPENASEVERDGLKGGGQEWLITRRLYVIHIRGVKWTPGGNVPAKATPNNTELGTGTNWTRVYDPKLISIVNFRHKLAP